MPQKSTLLKTTKLVIDEETGKAVAEVPREISEFIPKDETSQPITGVTIEMSDHSKVVMRGREFICKSCPFEHSLPIDPNKFTMNHDGQIVPIT